MSTTHASIEDHDEPGLYEIRIKGHLDDKWAAWFEGLTLTREHNGETRLSGPVVDQAALQRAFTAPRFYCKELGQRLLET
jgi:hypothetical protein